ncbi:MAG: hypothetical protein ABWK05_03765 [Pyrobaculum sp.]
MNNWAVFALAFVVTVALLFSTLAANVYSKEPLFKPPWEDQAARQAIIANASKIGIKAGSGPQGVVIVGYKDALGASNRLELLTTLRQLLDAASGYTVYLAPWAEDNATKAYLSLLYEGRLTLQEYLQGVVKNATGTSPRVDQALSLAKYVASVYRYQGTNYVPTPPIYVVVYRNDTTYVVYEPFTPGRDQTYGDWFQWVKTALENLRQGQGKTTP